MTRSPPAAQSSPGETRIVRGIAIVFVVKLLALSFLYFMSFSPAQRPDVGPGAVDSRLFGIRNPHQGATGQ